MTTLLFIFIISTMHPTVFTQYSLPNSRISLTHYCQVPSMIDDSVFNFTTMQDEYKDSIVRLNEKDYLRIHFCRPLKEPCKGKQDYAVCLHANKKEIRVGKEPPKITTAFEKIVFRYTGDKCNKTHNYTVDIEMKCNFDIKRIENNLDILYDRGQCDFHMAVESLAACARRKLFSCATHNEYDFYDFKTLRNNAGNYIIKLNQNMSVILNICRSLIYGQHFGKCNHETMVCLIDENNVKYPRYTRLGNINNRVNFYVKQRNLVLLELSSDTPCDKDYGTGLKTIRTTIEFACELNDTGNLPHYVTGLGTCHYKFRWLTATACTEDILIKRSKVNKQPCKITDPLYNELFDLSTLHPNFIVLEHSHHIGSMYQFSICTPLNNSNCIQSGIGVCKYIKDNNITVSKGLANNNVMWRRNQIFLNYTDGIACGNNRRSYTTIIFKCAFHLSVFAEDKDVCATIITLSTPAVCSHRCVTSDYSLNLQNLRLQDHNYHIRGESGGTEYHVNICEPLLDENYTNCTYGTGICKVSINFEGNRISEIGFSSKSCTERKMSCKNCDEAQRKLQNLGRQESGLKTAEDGRIYLSFLNGSICEENKNKTISTEITFTCDATIYAVKRVFLALGPAFKDDYSFGTFVYLMKGIPTLQSYKNCKYDFIWNSSLVCPKSNAVVNDGCHADNGGILNYTEVIENFNLKENRLVGTFHVDYCGRKIEARGTFICRSIIWNRKSLRKKENIDNKLVVFTFTNKTQCKNDNFYVSLIELWCTAWEDSAESFLCEEGNCDDVINWSVNKTCERNENTTEITKEITPESHDLSLVIPIVLAVVTVLASVGMAIYCYVYKDIRIACMNGPCNCVRRYRLLLAMRRRARQAGDIDLGMANL